MTKEELGSLIGPDNHSGTGSLGLDIFEFNDYRPKLVKYNNQTFMDSKQKNIKKSKDVINELSYQFGLHRGPTNQYASSGIVEEAEKYYNQIFEKKIMQRLPIRFIVTVSLYIACSTHGISISNQKITDILRNKYNIKTLNKYVNKVKTELLEFENARVELSQKDISKTAKYIMNKVELSILNDSDRQKVMETIEKLKPKNYVYASKDINGYIGAIIYTLFRDKKGLSQAYVAKITGLNQKTISNIYRQLKHLEEFSV